MTPHDGRVSFPGSCSASRRAVRWIATGYGRSSPSPARSGPGRHRSRRYRHDSQAEAVGEVEVVARGEERVGSGDAVLLSRPRQPARIEDEPGRGTGPGRPARSAQAAPGQAMQPRSLLIWREPSRGLHRPWSGNFQIRPPAPVPGPAAPIMGSRRVIRDQAKGFRRLRRLHLLDGPPIGLLGQAEDQGAGDAMRDHPPGDGEDLFLRLRRLDMAELGRELIRQCRDGGVVQVDEELVRLRIEFRGTPRRAAFLQPLLGIEDDDLRVPSNDASSAAPAWLGLLHRLGGRRLRRLRGRLHHLRWRRNISGRRHRIRSDGLPQFASSIASLKSVYLGPKDARHRQASLGYGRGPD